MKCKSVIVWVETNGVINLEQSIGNFENLLKRAEKRYEELKAKKVKILRADVFDM